MKKRIVIALGHRALGTTLPEQKKAVKTSAAVLADMVEEGYQLVITHSNAPQVGMIHTAMNEFGKTHPDYTVAPMSVCSAMSQGYIGYDLQNAIRAELLKRGIFKTVSTILTQVIVDPYDDAFHHPVKVIGRYRKEKNIPEIVSLTKEIDWSIEAHDPVNEMLKQLYRMINQLGQLDKSIILLYLEEKSYEEIAEITGLTVTNVATKLSRIKDKLKKMKKED